MNKKDLHKIIKEELDKIRSEANTKVDDQGYAGDYYHVISDIIETWADEQTITNDILGFLKAAFDTRGGNQAGDTKKGGEQLTRMVINAILKGIDQYRKQEPKDYMRESTVKEGMVKVFTYAKDYTGTDTADIKSKAMEIINKLKAARLNVSAFADENILYMPNGYKDLGPSIGVQVGENIYICEIGSSKMIKVSEPMAASMVQRGSLEAYNLPSTTQEAEKADKDYDGDGKIESPEAEYKGSVDKAIKKNMKEQDETPFLGKSDFSVENLDAGDLLEYDLVLDDLMAVIKKYKWIRNLDKSVIAKQVLHDKKLVADAIKKQKERRAIRKDYTPKPGRLKEAPTVYGEKEAIKMIWEDPGGKIESALKKISGYESVVQGASDKELYIYFTNKSAAMKGAMLLQHLVPGPEYKIRSEVDSYSIGIKA